MSGCEHMPPAPEQISTVHKSLSAQSALELQQPGTPVCVHKRPGPGHKSTEHELPSSHSAFVVQQFGICGCVHIPPGAGQRSNVHAMPSLQSLSLTQHESLSVSHGPVTATSDITGVKNPGPLSSVRTCTYRPFTFANIAPLIVATYGAEPNSTSVLAARTSTCKVVSVGTAPCGSVFHVTFDHGMFGTPPS